MNKTLRNILIGFVALLLLTGAFSGGVIVGWLIPSTNTAQTDLATQATATADDTTTLFKPFWEAWDIIHQNFIDESSLNDITLMQGAIRGMVSAVGDAHTLYMTPDEFTEATTPLSGSYGGIGAFVKTDGAYLTIDKPIEGSPAERAGLQHGDEVIAVNGVDQTGIDPNEVLKSVKGEAGTDVTLTIHRPNGDTTFDVTITRENIDYPTVTGRILTQDDLPKGSAVTLNENIAYIELSSFGENTADDLRTTLTELLKQNPKGIILDLRYNGGGYLETAVSVVSEFISDGVVVYEQDNAGNLSPYYATNGGLATDIPLVILVNESSASASEITAGALQDAGRATLVGVQTYGKGSVQYWIPLDGEQGAVSVTVARWLTPKERQIDGIGLTPDYVVELTDEDIASGNDLQLLKAIEVLQQRN